MTENLNHYISRNIRAFYRKRLFSPIVYFLILVGLWLLFPLGNLLFPKSVMENVSFRSIYQGKDPYVSCTFTNLRFTGYTSKKYNNTDGYFYYGMRNDECIIVLLAPSTCEEGIPFIESITVHGKILKSNPSYKQLLLKLSESLDWTESGISNQMPGYYFSEPAYNILGTIILFIFYFGTLLYTIISFFLFLLYARFPHLSPAVQNLIVFGHPKRMLAEAEEELATLPQLATEDMFITEHYFIVTSPYGNAIVPIQEILWIYKHSTLHKFLWYHFSISYTMHIIAKKHFYIHCPKNIKSDIDGIMDYLAEANHDILVGFSEENRLKVEKVLGKPFHIEKLIAFMHRKV